MHVFVVATALGLLSTTLAWQFTRFVGKWPAASSSLVILNFTWWYLWALMAPAVVWLAQHVQFARGSLARAVAVHVPAVIVFSFTAHRRHGSASTGGWPAREGRTTPGGRRSSARRSSISTGR